MKIIILQGLPFSGKTTFAMKWVAESHDRIRVCPEDILKTMGDGFRKQRLPLAYDAALRLTCMAVKSGMDVILDDCNLNGARYGIIAAKAQQLGASIEYMVIDTPPHICKERNRLSMSPISEVDIDRMAEKYKSILFKK